MAILKIKANLFIFERLEVKPTDMALLLFHLTKWKLTWFDKITMMINKRRKSQLN